MPQVTKPWRMPSKRVVMPAIQAETYPPMNSAMMLEITHHSPAPTPKLSPDGVLPAFVFTVPRPMPAPSRLRSTCTATAMTTPPNSAPQAIRL